MFKFLKSKKGFTLVELMIVVVIMAILVAVAVPIYSAVTANARKKTCIGNQRNIISQINNNVMSRPEILKATKDNDLKITITTNANGDGVADNGIVDDGIFEAGVFEAMFNASNRPYCPEKNGKIEVEVEPGGDAGSCEITVTCKSVDGSGASVGHAA